MQAQVGADKDIRRKLERGGWRVYSKAGRRRETRIEQTEGRKK